MENVKDLIADIRKNLSQTSASRKDEVSVMKAMLNDTSFVVDVYDKDGVSGAYRPAEDARNMVASIIASATKIPQQEAIQLAASYDFKNSDATTMVKLSKEFINTYLETGRKLPLGGREKSNISLALKEVPESMKYYPKKVGVNEDGTDRWDSAEKKVAAHNSIKVFSPCPEWCK